MRNRGYAHRWQLGPEARGRSALELLAREFSHSTQQEWGARLEAGEVTCDGVVLHAAAPVQPGQWLTWARPPWDEPDVPKDFELIHEDEALLVVAKPSGLPVMPAGGFLEHTLLHLLRERFGEASPVHRLGRGTSGLVVFSRTPSAHAALSKAMRERSLDKRYLALAQGQVAAPAVLRTPIGEVPHPRLGTVFAASPSGRPSETRVLTTAARGGDSLVELALITGRPHQIRIHLAAAGHPLVGDPLYLAGGAVRDALPGDLGYWLHAWRLTLQHPDTGLELTLEAPRPLELR